MKPRCFGILRHSLNRLVKMKLKKNYIHSNKRQIFRLIPTDTDKLIIEERETDKKQAFFNCLNIESGKKIFNDFQLDEKYWVGIEDTYRDVIFFHKFGKPDLPQHHGIIAFDINLQKTLWENEEHSFLFIKEGKVYSYRQKFEGREFFTIDWQTGKVMEELGTDAASLNLIREEVIASKYISGYKFPEVYDQSAGLNNNADEILKTLREKHLITGKIEFVLMNDLLMFNFHEIAGRNLLNNIFKAVDLSNEKYILEEALNSGTQAFAPDSFFVKDDLLFLLIDRTKLGVYKIINNIVQ